MMMTESPLKDKLVLVVDDEPDVLETVEEKLDMCLMHKKNGFSIFLEII